jgi:hypothetical protein
MFVATVEKFHLEKIFLRLFFPWFLPVFSEPRNRSEKGGAELVPPFCLYTYGGRFRTGKMPVPLR